MRAWMGLLAIGAVVACLGLAGCGSSGSSDPITVSVQATATETTTPDATEAPAAAPAPDASDATGVDSVAVPAGYHAVVWVRAGARVAMRTEPGGGQLV